MTDPIITSFNVISFNAIEMVEYGRLLGYFTALFQLQELYSTELYVIQS
jgi:hypothetical protein